MGMEVELGGLDVEATAATVAEVLGGEVHMASRFSARVEGTRLGDFGVELDSRPLKEGMHRRLLAELGLDLDTSSVGEWVESSVEGVARLIVPCEVVSPPIPVNELARTDPLWERLRTRRAEGTHGSLLFAFGLHFNPDVPRDDADGLLRYLRAFFLQYPRLVAASNIDLARRVTPFIDPFPQAYVDKVLDPGYRPTLDALIEDYLEDNPTRNRPLDMLPVFATLRPDRVFERATEPQLVAPRPTFHYRLPNSELGRPGWTPAPAWNRWVQVERLAEDTPRLEAALHERAGGSDARPFSARPRGPSDER